MKLTEVDRIVRPYVVVMVVTTLCVMALWKGEFKDALIGLAGTVVGFYFRGRDAAKKGEGS